MLTQWKGSTIYRIETATGRHRDQRAFGRFELRVKNIRIEQLMQSDKINQQDYLNLIVLDNKQIYTQTTTGIKAEMTKLWSNWLRDKRKGEIGRMIFWIKKTDPDFVPEYLEWWNCLPFQVIPCHSKSLHLQINGKRIKSNWILPAELPVFGAEGWMDGLKWHAELKREEKAIPSGYDKWTGGNGWKELEGTRKDATGKRLKVKRKYSSFEQLRGATKTSA